MEKKRRIGPRRLIVTDIEGDSVLPGGGCGGVDKGDIVPAAGFSGDGVGVGADNERTFGGGGIREIL